MATSFTDSTRRHIQDGALLLDRGRLANADQLFGLAAECALKGALTALGMKTTSKGAPERQHRLHIDALWPLTLALLTDRVGGRWSTLLGDGQPFHAWRIEQRYVADRNAPGRAVVDGHAEAAWRAARVLDAALLDGLAP